MRTSWRGKKGRKGGGGLARAQGAGEGGHLFEHSATFKRARAATDCYGDSGVHHHPHAGAGGSVGYFAQPACDVPPFVVHGAAAGAEAKAWRPSSKPWPPAAHQLVRFYPPTPAAAAAELLESCAATGAAPGAPPPAPPAVDGDALRWFTAGTGFSDELTGAAAQDQRTGGFFSCKTCGMAFLTRQALGGHRNACGSGGKRRGLKRAREPDAPAPSPAGALHPAPPASEAPAAPPTEQAGSSAEVAGASAEAAGASTEASGAST